VIYHEFGELHMWVYKITVLMTLCALQS